MDDDVAALRIPNITQENVDVYYVYENERFHRLTDNERLRWLPGVEKAYTSINNGVTTTTIASYQRDYETARSNFFRILRQVLQEQ